MSGKNIVSRIVLTTLKTFGVLFLLMVVMPFIGTWIFQLIWALLSGWFTHLARVSPQIEWNVELIFCFLLALTLGTWMLHRSLNWLHRQGVFHRAWSPKVTLSLTALLLMLFGMSVAMTGIVHQMIWVMKGPMVQTRWPNRIDVMAISNAKNLIVSCMSYAEDNEGKFPLHLSDLQNEGGAWVESDEDFYYKTTTKDFPVEPWVYYPWSTCDRTKLIMFHSSSPAFDGKWMVAKLDTSVKLVSDKEFQVMLATTKAAIHEKRYKESKTKAK